MLQIANIEEYTENDIPLLVDAILPILNARWRLHEKYARWANDIRLMYDENIKETVLPFEKFITDLAAGYLSGKPVYTVDITRDEEKNKILEDLLDVQPKDETYQKQMEVLIDFITSYNDDEQENHDLIHDVLEMRAAYEVLYENEDNEIVYSKFDPLQTVATWDYNIPPYLTGLVRIWYERSLNSNNKMKVEITDRNGSRIYDYDQEAKKATETDRSNHGWGDVPAIAVEVPFAIFEPCEALITKAEKLIQNIANTYQYNDADCKLKIVGYRPQNEAVIRNENGDYVINPARTAEDNAILNSKTFYIETEGDVSYITKPLDSSGAESMYKMYIDQMFQLAGIPNTSDLAFNSNNLNASAIDRKFYVMNMCTNMIISLLQKQYLRRWELIFHHINLKKGTKFDFRDIQIEIPKNLPSNESEQADFLLKLQEMISNQTIVEKLGFNYLAEKQKMDDEAADNIEKNLENMKRFGIDQTDREDVEDEEKLENDKQTVDQRSLEIY